MTSAALALVLVVGLALSWHPILPWYAAAGLAIAFAWMVWPGAIIARRVYASQRAWPAALLVAPAWGFGVSSVVLLALWAAGIRSTAMLATAPILAALATIPCRRLAGALELPAFDRRDAAPLLIVLMLVPLVVGRPFARVGETTPYGKAYRAYFIADFEWAMAAVSEVSKGDVPPRNPFLAGETLHYYWLADLFSSVEHRATTGRITIEQILLVNDTLIGLAFAGFLYFFVRHFVRSPSAAAIACVFAVLFSSFEGAQQVYAFWERGVPVRAAFEALRNTNIDAISNWKFGSLKVDGLHRALLYQPQHMLTWSLSLSALLVLRQARDAGRAAVNAFAATLLGIGLLVSSFIAMFVGVVVGVYQGARLLLARRWTAIVVAGAAGAIPVGAALAVTMMLHYVDRNSGQIVFVGALNPLAGHNTWTGIVLSFGPMLIAAAVGAVIAIVRRASELAVLGLVIAIGWFFYFFVDVVDHQHAYVGWRAGHLLFIAFAPLAGYAWQELWARGRVARSAAAAGGLVLALGAAPMIAIDLYNTQDIDNRRPGPSFHWTEILSPDEIAALQWVKTSTPPDALVQVDPIHDGVEGGVWAYMPAFGERRMTAGVPISMIPAKRYLEAGEQVRQMFTATDARAAYAKASALDVQYIYLGPEEQRVYPQLRALLDGAPDRFQTVFRNASVSVYRVVRGVA
ncbi:MAG TPA: DUF6541 family protein [Vicinamibacterales bacterium]|nr:DUF6541 family protein [Vicinamibacterales bacterium]